MKRLILVLFFVLSAVAIGAAVEAGEYAYKGSDAATGAAGVKALIVLLVLGAGALYVTHWLKKNGFPVSGQAQATGPGNITERKISLDKKIVTYEAEGCAYILGVTKDNIILIDKLTRRQGKVKK